jgi:anti-anti-sigma factor
LYEQVVPVRGELDCASGPVVEADLVRRLAEGGDLAADLSGVTFIDCAGLGSLIAVRRWATERGLRFGILGPPPVVGRLLLAAGPDLLEIVPRRSFSPAAGGRKLVAMEATATDLATTTEKLHVAEEEVRVQQDLIERLVRGRTAARLAGIRLAAALPVPLLSTDRDGLVVEANPAAAVLVNLDPARLRGKPLTVLVDPADRRPLRGALAGGAGQLRLTVTPRRRDGVTVDAVVLPVVEPARGPLPEEAEDDGPAVQWVLMPRPDAARADEPALLRALGATATLTVAGGDLRAALTRLAGLSVEALGPATCASVVVGPPAEPAVLVSTDQLAQTVDGAQHRAGQGPGWDAYRSATPVSTAVLGFDRRWPGLNALLPVGTDGAIAVPIRTVGGRTEGVLTVYGAADLADPGPVQRVGLFAAVAAALLTEHAVLSELRHQEAQLREALLSRAVIDQAKGILMARHRVGAETAFAELARRSQRANVKLREVARQLVEEVTAGSAPDVRPARR